MKRKMTIKNMVVENENQELNRLLATKSDSKPRGRMHPAYQGDQCGEPEVNEDLSRDQLGKLCQWTTGDNKRFIPSGLTKESLPPGVYEVHHSSQIGMYFEKIPVRTEGLIRFPQTNSERVLKEIETFWNKEQIFKDFKLAHKRGIILWGPPGGGKTCTINLIMKDVVDRGGVVIKFTQPALFIEGMRILREIQPTTPVVVLMEDVDSIIEHYEESQVLNILDGVESVQKVVFLATTNYPEMLGPRILNRPSRFDKRFKIGYPNDESRQMYLEHLCGDHKPEDLNVDIKKWVKETKNFSIAHLKELFVAVVILGDDYKEAIENLRLMKEHISSEDDEEKNMGFGLHKDE
jgi:GTPase SAR1 family protein